MTPKQFEDIFHKVKQQANLVQTLRTFVFNLATNGKLTDKEIAKNEVKNLGSCVELIMGQAPRGESCNSDGNGTMFVKVGEFGSLYPQEINWTTEPKKHAKSGDVLICVVGATIGKLNLGVDCAIGRSVAAIRPDPILDSKFLYYSLQPYSLSLRKNAQGTAQAVIGKKDLNAIEIWIPTLEEQKRITAKVDELMALCDKLEDAQQRYASSNSNFSRSLFAELAQSPNAALVLQFNEKFKQSIKGKAELKKLKQFVHKLAIHGKLTEKIPSDGSVSQFIEEIQAFKQVAGLGKAKVAKLPIELALHPIPDHWTWSSVSQVTTCLDGRRIPVSKAERAKRGKVYDYYGASGVIDKIDDYIFDDTKLLIGEDGANLLSRSTPIAFLAHGKYWVNNHAHVLDGIDEEFLEYCAIYVNAIDLSLFVTGTAQPKMNQAKMNSIPIAIPPRAEMGRLVKKVKTLLALCDELETSLLREEIIRTDLLKTLVA